jgi:hypothetical protein
MKTLGFVSHILNNIKKLFCEQFQILEHVFANSQVKRNGKGVFFGVCIFKSLFSTLQ